MYKISRRTRNEVRISSFGLPLNLSGGKYLPINYCTFFVYRGPASRDLAALETCPRQTPTRG